MPQRFFNANEATQLAYMVLESGSAATLIQNTGSVPIDAGRPSLGNTKVETSTAGTALLTRVAKRFVDGQTVQATDFMAMFTPSDVAVEPEEGDHFEQNGIRYTVTMARPLYPGAVNLLWRVFLRR